MHKKSAKLLQRVVGRGGTRKKVRAEKETQRFEETSGEIAARTKGTTVVPKTA